MEKKTAAFAPLSAQIPSRCNMQLEAFWQSIKPSKVVWMTKPNGFGHLLFSQTEKGLWQAWFYADFHHISNGLPGLDKLLDFTKHFEATTRKEIIVQTQAFLKSENINIKIEPDIEKQFYLWTSKTFYECKATFRNHQKGWKYNVTGKHQIESQNFFVTRKAAAQSAFQEILHSAFKNSYV